MLAETIINSHLFKIQKKHWKKILSWMPRLFIIPLVLWWWLMPSPIQLHLLSNISRWQWCHRQVQWQMWSCCQLSQVVMLPWWQPHMRRQVCQFSWRYRWLRQWILFTWCPGYGLQKKKITNPKDYVLLSILVPLDQTVTSLQGMKDLCIMKQVLLDSLNPGLGKKPTRVMDLNGQCDFFFFLADYLKNAHGWMGIKKALIFDKNKHYSDLLQDVIDFLSVYRVSCCLLFFFWAQGLWAIYHCCMCFF